ncbi:MAG: hypothetical protein ACI92E_001630 [Oceanicoccus sp.]|jgi:hypothetical protein
MAQIRGDTVKSTRYFSNHLDYRQIIARQLGVQA